jgi:hypothetical protein
VLAALVERLGAFVEKPGDAAAGGHRVRVRLWGEALSADEVRAVLAENQANFVETIAAIIRDGQAEGTFDADADPEALARVLMAFHQGMVLQKALSPDTSVQPAFEEFRALLRDTAS